MDKNEFLKILADVAKEYGAYVITADEVSKKFCDDDGLPDFSELEQESDLLFECGYGRNYNDSRYDSYNGYYND